MNYYQVLNLNPEVYQDKIKRRYKELAKKFHPDKWPGDDSIFRRIKEAYEVLSNVDRRKVYDQVYGFETLDKDYGFVVNIPLRPHEVLKKLPIFASYRRRNVCVCEGRNEDCNYCSGNGIMSEDIEMIFRDTDIYYDGMTFTIDSGGTTNKYGEIKEVSGIINYQYDRNLGSVQRFDFGEHDGYFLYTMKLSDEQFQKDICDLGHVAVDIIDYGALKLSKDCFSNGNIVSTEHPRLKICLNVFVKDLSKFLKL